MRGEAFLLISSSLILLISIVIVYIMNNKYGLIHFVVFFILSYLLYLNYFSIEEGESATKSLLFNIIYSWMHSLIILFYIVNHWFNKKKN